jgi:hypothetical protein
MLQGYGAGPKDSPGRDGSRRGANRARSSDCDARTRAFYSVSTERPNRIRLGMLCNMESIHAARRLLFFYVRNI